MKWPKLEINGVEINTDPVFTKQDLLRKLLFADSIKREALKMQRKEKRKLK